MKKSFSPEELKVLEQKPGVFGRAGSNILNTAISYRENTNRTYFEHDPLWIGAASDSYRMVCDLYDQYLSRPNATNYTPEGHYDVFGAKWQYIESAGGSITVGGKPLFSDANEWRDAIKIPDVTKWDWAADAAKNKQDTRFSVLMTFANGFWFERLISLMDFENAAIALVDPDQQDAIASLFEEMTDMACDLVDMICQYFPCVDGFMLHDDWGSQRSPFFSDEIARKLFLPYMTELVSHIHNKGRYAAIHSCGHVETRVNILVESGLDGWQLQTMNDIRKLYDAVGDKLVLEAWPENFDVTDNDAAVAAAREFVDYFSKPGKAVLLGSGARFATASDAFNEEIYRYSRKVYLKR